MEFRIADTFTDSLARLTDAEQKLAKTTAFDLQLNPASPGMQFHRLNKSRDSNFWSVRVSSDLRLIIHRTASALMLCYVDHHDAAYAWAERRKIERHPQTGAAQLVEVRETVREIVVPKYVEAASQAPKRLFSDVPEWVFLSHGVPPEWMNDVRGATEDTLFEVAEHLPQEAAELLLNLATGAPLPSLRLDLPPHIDAFQHPDAQRRFRVVQNREELERALAEPWEKWTIFLHPAQRELVERQFSGPARVGGSAGTPASTGVSPVGMRSGSINWQISMPGNSEIGYDARLIISRAIVPSNPAWMVGAVKWTSNPILAKELRPSILAA